MKEKFFPSQYSAIVVPPYVVPAAFVLQ